MERLIQVVNTDGELIQEINTKKERRPSEPAYAKFYYITAFDYLKEVNGATLKLFMALVAEMGFNNEIFLVKSIKSDLSKFTGISIHTINNAISELRKKGCIFAKGSGRYIINPSIYCKGTWKEIHKRIVNNSIEGESVNINEVNKVKRA